MKTSAAIQQTIDTLKVEHQKNTNYRMENYFNCVDDYSWGGLCDQAQDQAMNRLRRLLDIVKTQEENGGFLIEEGVQFELQDLSGNVLSNRLVEGRFGLCFIIGGGDNVSFVGASVKQSTFESKGYRAVTKKYSFKVIYDGTLNSKFANRSVELLSVEEVVEQKLNYSTPNDTTMWLHLQNN